MKCGKCRKLHNAYLDGQLREGIRAEFEAHLAACGSCSEMVSEAQRIKLSLQSLGEVKAPEDVWLAVRERIAAVDRTGVLQRRRARRVKLVSIPALALLAAGIVMLFVRPDVADWPLENAFNHQDREYLRYVQAYSNFQSQQSLDPDAMRISEELSREKVLRGE